jgi:hypothetical protein
MTVPRLSSTRPSGKVTVLISWDGRALPLSCVHLDAVPDFELILFDYSGRAVSGTSLTLERGAFRLAAKVLSERTECKGEIFQALGRHLGGCSEIPEYVGVLDDDIVITVADINRTLHIARIKQLDVCSPALTHDSAFSHRWTLQQPHILAREVPWIEVMMPFYRGDLLLAAVPFFSGFVSSWGFDNFLFPMMQKLTGAERCGLIDVVTASHYRPVSSQTKVYKNGMTAAQELVAVKKVCIDFIKNNHPELLNTAWFDRIFVRQDGYSRTQRYMYRLGRPIKRWLAKSA